MSWAVLFRVREYLKGSLWYGPVAGAVLGPLLAVLTRQADTSLTVPKAWQYAPSTASTVLTTIVGATVGLTGFVVTVTILAIQMATGTFSARYIRIGCRPVKIADRLGQSGGLGDPLGGSQSPPDRSLVRSAARGPRSGVPVPVTLNLELPVSPRPLVSPRLHGPASGWPGSISRLPW
ncbi:MAG TPA: DUF2254 family protein [Streptosporangiaceae bacterium]|nr:DUF2254 family protein [Streptosporangiaceae bacterium]